jgi:hypothetical protein
MSKLRGLASACVMLALACPAAAMAATFRYASSTNRIYVGGAGVVTLSRIKARLPGAPLQRSGRTWLLGANLQLERGATLQLHGAAAGGDVDELRLKSDNTGADDAVVSITADYGELDIQATRITSWDSVAGAPDSEYAAHGRAFIRVRSRLADDGVTPLESRMDIVDAEIAYLGYDAPEARGLSWKVVDDAGDAYDRVQVRGDVFGSNIHHDFDGLDGIGVQGAIWRDNRIEHAVGSGLVLQHAGDTLVEHNRVLDCALALKLSDSQGVTVRANDFAAAPLGIAGSTGVELAGNAIDAPVTVSGDPALGADVAFSDQPLIDLVLDTNSVARFVDAGHAVFDIEPDADLPTFVWPGGSELRLHGRDIGGATRVFRRSLQSFGASGVTLQVVPAAWTDLARDWTVVADRKIWRARFVMGDLAPGALYSVLSGNVPLVLRADANGSIQFPAISTGAGPVGFSVIRLKK